MSLVVQSHGLGSSTCVTRDGRSHHQRVAFKSKLAAHQVAVEVRKKQATLALKRHHSTTKELLEAMPEYRQLVKEMTKYRLDQVPIYVNNKEYASRNTTVPRREFLAASTSLAAAKDFLKQKVGVSSQQKVKITYSLASVPEELGVYDEEYELNEQALEEHSMPYFVGYANGWFVSEL